MINLKEEQLKLFLQEAYKAGWHGCLELEETAVNEILAKAKAASPVQNQQMFFQLGPSSEQSTVPSHINLSSTYTINASENYNINSPPITITDIESNTNIYQYVQSQRRHNS